MGKVYRLGQLTLIEEKAIELLTYVRSYDKEPLPRCFDFIKLIIHNIAADKVDGCELLGNKLPSFLFQPLLLS